MEAMIIVQETLSTPSVTVSAAQPALWQSSACSHTIPAIRRSLIQVLKTRPVSSFPTLHQAVRRQSLQGEFLVTQGQEEETLYQAQESQSQGIFITFQGSEYHTTLQRVEKIEEKSFKTGSRTGLGRKTNNF